MIYVYSIIIFSTTRFYIGQKVRAQHGQGSARRWYDARVLQLDVGPTIGSKTATKRCFLHYLGWNMRYDEWVGTAKIRVSTAVSIGFFDCYSFALMFLILALWGISRPFVSHFCFCTRDRILSASKVTESIAMIFTTEFWLISRIYQV